jgi:hypothetical protein
VGQRVHLQGSNSMENSTLTHRFSPIRMQRRRSGCGAMQPVPPMAEYAFQYSEQHLVTSASRYRQHVLTRFWLSPFKLVGFVGLAALLVFGLYNSLVVPSAIFAAALVLLILGPRIDYWVMKRRFRRSPFYNSDVRILVTPDGIVSSDAISRVELAWSAFTKARRFPDGLLVVLGQAQFYWLPDSALHTGTVSEVENLLRLNIARYLGA